MSCWVLVPIKRRAACKSRLAGELAYAQRLQLVRVMLACVIGAVRDSHAIDGIAFVSAERDTIPAEIPVFADPGGGLNAALEAARAALVTRGVDALIVLPADLPAITSRDVALLGEVGGHAGFAFATDCSALGTNALWLPARAPFRFQFGPGSRRRHLFEAERLGMTPALVSAPGLAFDIDSPEDLQRLFASDDPRFVSLRFSSGETPWRVRQQTQVG
jgi:2-phospho-L-lactate guanylyltransferase